MIKKEKIKAYALQNAVAHDGKCVFNAILGSLFSDGLEKDKIKDYSGLINEVVDEVNSMSLKEQEKEFENFEEFLGENKRKEREGLSELENAEIGKVVLRFAPFPSGPLHIGNTRQLILNDEYAKKYKGELILVMDDTIGSEEKPIVNEAYGLIEAGVKWLGADYNNKVVYKSDRIDTYYSYAEELIKKGYMYVCSCSQDKVRELRKKGIECDCRSFSDLENHERWKKMFSANEGDYIVRLKTGMENSNPAFRDRVMFRISERSHPKLGNKYRVWPLLEFSWAIDDHLLGVTHIIRGIDLIMETEVEKFIWDIFQWPHLKVIHTGHFSIEGIKISKSKGAKEVLSGEYIGWNDPRTWSLQSLKDRGILPESIREFILGMGLTKTNSSVAIDVLYSLNKKRLEQRNSKRFFFVEKPIKITIPGTPKINGQLPMHPSKDLGVRKYKTLQEFYIPEKDFNNFKDKNYRLMHLLNFKTDKFNSMKPRDFSFISEEPDKTLNVDFLHWIPGDSANEKKNFKTIVRMSDNSIVEGLCGRAIEELEIGDIIQFERFGFARLHALDKKTRKAEFWFTH